MYRKTLGGFILLGIFLFLIAWPVLGAFGVINAFPLELGIDLQGGTRLVYKLDLSHVPDDPRQVAQDVKDIITGRLNRFGLKDLSISVQGDDRLEVQLPGADPATVAEIKKQIERAGTLAFHIVMTSEEHVRNMARYEAEERRYEEAQREYARRFREWSRRREAAEAEGKPFNEPPPKAPTPPPYIVRPLGRWVEQPDGTYEFQPGAGGKRVLGNTEDLKVDGRYLSEVTQTVDENLNPAIGFAFRGEGAARFADLTGNHIGELLAIVLDRDIMQEATIESRIVGRGILRGRFTTEEIRGIISVLRGGSLPTSPVLESESTVGSLFGRASVISSVLAVVVGLGSVMLCMAIYYLAAGMVANFALVFNILVVIAYLTCFGHTLTLPGIAGLILSIGMAVDANILIFERIREERRRGRGLLQAMTIGYQRAFSVIFDSNLTTIITGLVLYNVGTVQVKGFAITLVAGVIVSFVSALFVTRLILSAAYNARWLTELKMLQAFETPRVPFSGYQRRFLFATLAVIVASWVLVIERGRANYGIDFNGGARLTFNIVEPRTGEELKEKVREIASKNPDLEEAFRDWSLQSVSPDLEGRATRFTLMTLLGSEARTATAHAQETAPSAPAAEENTAEEPVGRTEPAALLLQRLRRALEQGLREVGLLEPEGVRVLESEAAAAGSGLVFEVNLRRLSITKEELRNMLDRYLEEQFPQAGIGVAEIRTEPQDGPGAERIRRLRVALTPYTEPDPSAPPEEREGKPRRIEIIEAVQNFFSSPPPREEGASETAFEITEPFSEVTTVSSRVARDLQGKALIAIFISMLGIIFYITLRFEFIFGLAAIAALVHDVLITIGILAVTDHFLGSTLPIKINLPEVAAILTIIGYSINDTIVVFDRIRENLGIYAKKKLDFVDCVDMSINQTLGRTVLTSFTTLITVLSLLIFGGEAVRGFAYAFAIGLVTGTYSSVFVASPILIALHKRAQARREARAAEAAA